MFKLQRCRGEKLNWWRMLSFMVKITNKWDFKKRHTRAWRTYYRVERVFRRAACSCTSMAVTPQSAEINSTGACVMRWQKMQMRHVGRRMLRKVTLRSARPDCKLCVSDSRGNSAVVAFVCIFLFTSVSEWTSQTTFERIEHQQMFARQLSLDAFNTT